jgi:hypothetical protein
MKKINKISETINGIDSFICWGSGMFYPEILILFWYDDVLFFFHDVEA